MNKDNITFASRQFIRLIGILQDLRGKNGCPWDREQTAKSLIPYMLEETYEIIEAIEEDNEDLLQEELGDLTLHILFQACIAEEQGKFHIGDSLKHISDKLVRRHPHVFGGVVLKDKRDINLTWEASKQQEKNRTNLLDGVPKTLPALTRARRVQEKASNVGFDWTDIDPVWDKLFEEINELKAAVREKNNLKIEEEMGDVLFSMVNLGRFLNVSAEESLRMSISKFSKRFNAVESELKKQGKSLAESSLEEMDVVWESVKKGVIR